MAEVYCGSEPCPLLLNSTCVFYTGQNLLYIGVNTNDNLEIIIEKINQAFQNAGVGYAFTNGLTQPTPFQPVQLGGALIQNTTIGGNFTLEFTGNLKAAKHITTGGTSSQFVKGDGTLDSTAYQPAANYITSLTGDVLASGPGAAVATLATVNFAAGTFGNGNTIPIVTVNSKGLVTNITPTPINLPPLPLSFIGDVVGSGFTGSNITMLLQNVNPNPYNTITPLKFKVNGKGLVTGASPITASDIVNILGYYPGTSGTAGSSGTSGTSGTTGTSGSSGTSATSGTSGTSGTSATSGTSGTSGVNGASGTSGTSGTSVAVSGTTNTMAKFTSSTTIGNSLLTDDGSTLTYNGSTIISGAASPTGSVIGAVRAYGSSSAYMGASDASGRTAFFGVDSSGYAMFGALTNHDTVIRANNVEYLRVYTSGYTVISGSTRSPIFYDSNNTGYYLDPASTSVMNVLNFPSGSSTINTTTPGTSGYQLNFTGQTTPDYAQAITWGWSSSGAQAGIYVQSSGSYGTRMYIATTDSFATGSKTAMTINESGIITTTRNYLEATGSLRAPIFYDSNNTLYYLDPTDSNVSLLIGGSVNANGSFASNGWSSSSANESVRVYAPKGASASWDGGITGAFRIKLPQRANNTMWSMKVRIYNYADNQVSEYVIGNYSYSAGGWNSSAHFIGAANSEVHNVRLGNQDGVDCVWIGETNTSWSYPVVSVISFEGGFRNGNANTWDNDWNITYVTSFGTVASVIYPSVKLGDIYSSGTYNSSIFSGGACNYEAYLNSFGVGGYYASDYDWRINSCSIRVDSYGATIDLGPYSMIQSPPSGECFYYDGFSGTLYIGGNICQNYYSDCKYKENITEIDSALDKIEAMRGVEFDWNELGEEEAFRKGHEVGVIAQEVQVVYPQAVREVSKEREDHVVTALVVDYEKFTPLLIQSIKELKGQVDNIKSRLDAGGL